ncbi:CaiB/BaiF CoA transferase family protein [Gordonia polyisoprenivorans]|uniref:CaiB/BaiF CoA transferase family protein n=1 Tax=Gordonia polyisoprenivorans TaxID=84595 RepID=UPI0023016F31|nr:CoA transferase [Gordonia polyisoprenivorans]WCB38953.1 CoA transferase [Gordonia polyisoprenivorans]
MSTNHTPTRSSSHSGDALEGVVVLDLGQVYAGPYCTHLLRSLGATVIKIEPFGGEPIRWRSTGESSGQAFLMLNAGKLGARIDLKSGRGRELFCDLVRHADVVVENFAPGVMERLQLGFEVLHDINPALVLASGRAYGEHPATRGLRGMDVTVQAMSGMVSATGFPDGAPVKSGGAVVDFAAGSHLTSAVLAALFQRERTGIGQHVEVAMQDAILPTLTSNIAGLLESEGDFPERTGNRHGGLAVCPYNIYPASDGWIAILCLRPKHWIDLCRLMARPDLAGDSALATPAGRVDRMDDVDAAVTAWTAASTTDEVFSSLQQADVPAAPVRSLPEVINDPALRDRGMLGEIGSGDRKCTILGSPIQMGTPTPAPRGPAPLVGEDTDEVLRTFLHLADEEIEALHADNVI